MVYRGKTAPRRRTGSRQRTREDRISGKLAACLWILFLAVAARTMFPEETEEVSRAVLAAVSGDVDYEEAVAVMGQAVRGERGISDALNIAWNCAFRGETDGIETLTQPSDPPVMPAGTESGTNIPASDGSSEDVAVMRPEAESSELPEGVSGDAPELGIAVTCPAQGTRTSSFGYREHPEDGEVRFHYGLDLAAERGTDVVSFADGTVLASGDSSGYGLYLLVDHGGGVQTLYAHLDEIVVAAGDAVAAGQIIGKMGDSGNATAPCLHFELTLNGVYLDPEHYI